MIMYIILKNGKHIEHSNVSQEELITIITRFSANKKSRGLLMFADEADKVFAAIRWCDISAIYAPGESHERKIYELGKESNTYES